MNRIARIATAGTIAAVAAVSLSACGHDNFKDLKDVQNVHPGYIKNIENMDGHPNLGFLCVYGTPILTTTRNNAADVRVLTNARAVKFCAKQPNYK